MTLPEKILALYPELTLSDFDIDTGTILLQNDSDGRGDYIKEWNHPTLPCPTDEQLASFDPIVEESLEPVIEGAEPEQPTI